MSLHLSEVTNKSDFSSVVVVEHEAYSTPFNAFWEALKGPSIDECTSRQWAWHEGTKGSHWLQIKDSNGHVVGGGQWVIYETNPFAEQQPPLKADWWPDGKYKLTTSCYTCNTLSNKNPLRQDANILFLLLENLRDISDQMLVKFMSGRPHRMNRPHLCKFRVIELLRHAFIFSIYQCLLVGT